MNTRKSATMVTAKEFEKALDFAAYGASQGVGKPSVEHLENKQWDYGMRNWLAEQEDNRSFNNWYRQQVIQHPEWFDENGNRIITPAEGDNFDEFGVSEDETFTTYKLWNEYQTTGDVPLRRDDAFTDPVRKKFRIWRLTIPRALKNDTNRNGLDRMRNPWTNIEFRKHMDDDKFMMQLHDIVIKYFE